MTSPFAAWSAVQRSIGVEPGLDEAEARLQFSGDEPLLSSRFLLGTAGAATLAAIGSAVSDLWVMRGGAPLQIGIDLGAAAASLRSSSYLRIDDAAPPSPWDPIAGFYRAADDRYIQLHTNFPHHRDGTCRVLGVAPERADVAAAIARRSAFELEDALADAGLCATATRTRAEWFAHPQGEAVATQPLLTVTRIGDADPEPLTPGAARALSGVRVLDLTRVLAGPTAGRALAEHGADVLAIASPELPNLPAIVLDTNHGKRSAHLHLRAAADHARLRALCADSDVFLQSYRPGALAALGFGADELAQLRPGIVCVDLSAYGALGPWSGRRGYDTLVQSACGIAHEQGETLAGDGAPQHLPCSALDYLTGYLAAFGTLTALARRAVQGGSWHVEVSLAQTACWLDALGRVPPELHIDGRNPDAAPLLQTAPSIVGQLQFLGPVLRLSGMPRTWPFVSAPLGTHRPEW